MKFYHAQEQYDRLREEVIKSIQAHFTEPREEFDVETPLVLASHDDDVNMDEIIVTIRKDSISKAYSYNTSLQERMEFDQLETRQLIWILEQLDEGKGDWDADYEDEDEE